MNIINLDDLNQKILDADMIGLFYTCTYTPPINSLKVVSDSVYLDKIKRLIFSSPKSDDFRISEDLSFDMYQYMKSSRISEEEKNIVSRYMSEKLKEKVFNEYLKDEFKNKNFKVDPDDYEKSYWFTPKIYGVPLKTCFESYGSICITDNELKYDEAISFLEQASNKTNDYNFFLKLKCLLQQDDYFSKSWCPSRVKSMTEILLNNQDLKKYQDCVCKYNNEMLKKSVLESSTVEHEFHFDNNIKSKIINSVPKDFSNVERAIYVYTKLCQIFSYDPVYYFKEEAGNHSSIANIENYNEENNEVVCYEFAYILSDVLKDMGISHIKERNNEEQKFQNSHTNISFLVDDFVIFADSTTTVEAGDLSSSKYSLDLKGIRCMQYDDEIQQRFMQAKGKVKSYIVEQDEKYNMMIPNKDYIEELNENQKVVLFNNCLVNCDLENIDFLSYANKLISVLDLNINTSIYCDNETESKILLNVSLDNYTDFENDRISYFIDSTNKTIYDSSNELTLKGKNSSKK